MKYSTRQSKQKSSEKYDAPIIFVSSAFRERPLAQLKGAPLSVYLAYKSYANKEGLAWPSLGTLARVTGYGINAVKRSKQTLIEMGLLTPIEQSRDGGQFGRKKFRVNTVAPKQDRGTVAPSTVAPSTVAPKQCQEGSPSEGFPIEGYPIDAVRRPVDAEHRIATKPFSPPLEGKAKAKPSERRAKLSARLAKAIRVNGNQFEDGLDRDERAVLQAAAKATCYEMRDLEIVTDGFVFTLMEVYEKHKDDGLSPGILSCKVIDRCMSEQEACKKMGTDPSEYYWPPGFQEHRNRLRAEEQAVERRQPEPKKPEEHPRGKSKQMPDPRKPANRKTNQLGAWQGMGSTPAEIAGLLERSGETIADYLAHWARGKCQAADYKNREPFDDQQKEIERLIQINELSNYKNVGSLEKYCKDRLDSFRWAFAAIDYPFAWDNPMLGEEFCQNLEYVVEASQAESPRPKKWELCERVLDRCEKSWSELGEYCDVSLAYHPPDFNEHINHLFQQEEG